MKNLVLREFYSERDVVMEERRLRTENSPFGLLIEQLNAATFTAHPYSWPVIGWMSDIENMKKADVAKYFEQYYSPNNAVIVVVGDINPDEVINLIEKYFSDIQRQPPPPEVTTVEPEQIEESVEFMWNMTLIPYCLLLTINPQLVTRINMYLMLSPQFFQMGGLRGCIKV